MDVLFSKELKYGIRNSLSFNQPSDAWWKDDPTITVTIVSERRICYEGEETSISSLSAKLKGYKVKHIAPGAHWLYKEKLLSDIYDETYPFEE